MENIARWADAGRRHAALGMICTDWGDFGHYNLQGNSWLAYAWAAQQAWSGAVDSKRFDRAFGRLLFGETRAEAARCYRELGAVHDAGFPVFNGSALQFLFFDDLDRAFFLQQATPAALRRSAKRLERCITRIRNAAGAIRSKQRARCVGVARLARTPRSARRAGPHAPRANPGEPGGRAGDAGAQVGAPLAGAQPRLELRDHAAATLSVGPESTAGSARTAAWRAPRTAAALRGDRNAHHHEGASRPL
jgi:hypothetical protein